MPPSPSLRRSPARELRMDNIHKRGGSSENGLPTKANKDDDLALFNEMQNRENDNFLLHIPDDFNDSLNFNLGINIPARGESSDLLNADSEKNDYEWLLTPPDTPLFPSLDDDGTQPVNLSRGRTRSQAISIAKPSMSEKTPRTSRSSASPYRLSSSPRTDNNFQQSRSRPSSVPRSSPPSIIQPPTPSWSPSTPPASYATMPTARSLTPTMRRMSTGSSRQPVLSTRRGTSPVKSNRGNSSSPKLRGWQPGLAAFSLDAPPNLRTSLSDRSASRIRGFSPASATSGGRNSKCSRNSTSPSAPRSVSLSQTLGRDNFASCSRVSMASSFDDEDESIPSIIVGLSGISSTRKHGAFESNKPMAFSKKSSRSPSANSSLKKSFDSAVRQMDNLKAPQNMFRSLLSSVPATTFYSGKLSSVHRTLFSQNSSLTTSSNASSEQGASFATDIEYIDHNQNDVGGEWEKVKDPETEEEIFIFDKLDDLSGGKNYDLETVNISLHEGNSSLVVTNEVDSQELKNSIGNFDLAAETSHYQSDFAAESYEIDCKGSLQTCSKCGIQFFVIAVNQMLDICEECAAVDGLLASEELQAAPISVKSDNTLGSNVQLDTLSPKLSENNRNEVLIVQNKSKYEHGAELSIDRNSIDLIIGKNEVCLCDEIDCLEKESTSGGGCTSHHCEPTGYQVLRADDSEGTGISVLLMQKSNSSKWSVVHGRTFSASNIFCSEPSYVRGNTSTMKQSFSRQSSLPPSSLDLTSSRQMDDREVHQLSSMKGEGDNIRSNNNVIVQSSDSHSVTSTSTAEPIIQVTWENDEGSCMHEKMLNSGKYILDGSVNSNSLKCSVLEHAFVRDDICIFSETSGASSNLYSQANQQVIIQNSDYSVTSNFDNWNYTSHEIQNIGRCILDTDETVTASDCTTNVENLTLDKLDGQVDTSDDSIHTALITVQDQEDNSCYRNLQNNAMPDQVINSSEDFQEASYSISYDKDASVTASESNDILVATEESIVPDHLVNEEPCTVVETPKGIVQRSFTLEEATDTVLFCSSIVHDIAYKAVTVEMEKELKLPEASHLTLAISEKSVSNRTDFHNISDKRVPISRKVKRKIPEADTKVPIADLGYDTKDHPVPARANHKGLNTLDSMKPPKLESKCNCTVM